MQLVLLLSSDTSADPKIFKIPKLAKNIYIDLSVYHNYYM